MKKNILVIGAVLLLCWGVSLSWGEQSGVSLDEIQDKAIKVFAKSCSVAGCHSAPYPAMDLTFEKDQLINILVGTPSKQRTELKLIDPDDPGQSYLLKKVRGDSDIVGGRMPANSPPLSAEDMAIIETFIKSFVGASTEERSDLEPIEFDPPFEKPDFWGIRLINLPTTHPIDKGRFLFQISHRFFPAVKEGFDFFFGLDGPAAMLLGLGYGITENFSVILSRSNRFKDVELAAKWRILRQSKSSGFPFSVSFNISGSSITQALGDEVKRSSVNIQLLISRQISNRLSLLMAPSFSSNPIPWENSGDKSFSMGTGISWMFLDDLSLIAEWIPVINGYRAESSGWGVGIEKKIGGHVFQIFLLNTLGITTPQYLPGGDFELNETEFRIGFNIFRLF